MAAMSIVFCVSWDCVKPKNGGFVSNQQMFHIQPADVLDLVLG